MSLLKKFSRCQTRPIKRRRLQKEEVPDTDSDVTCDSDGEGEEYDIVKFLPSDILGSVFFGGYINSLEVVKTASCICKELAEIAKEKVIMLDLRRCPLMVNSDLPSLTKRFPNLQDLDLSYCEDIDYVKGLIPLRLRILNLRGTDIRDNGILSLLKSKNARNLEKLDLSACDSDSSDLITDDTVKILSNLCKNLRVLKLGWRRQITDSAIRFLSNLKHLEELNLCLTNITATGCSILSKCKSIKKLNLSACPIGERGLQNLLPSGSISNLTHLSLRFNREVDENSLACLIDQTPKLEFLNVEHCGLTREGLKKVFHPLQLRGVEIKVERSPSNDNVGSVEL
mmetsp:Transcript_24121/g.35746  ORF Transcript_24121/g.35746 Transcript_24121/m.35746 type:complete len:341 (-) Transcript_24121:48-1070(-)|eukprot:CAMPEP_0194215818 /NCGR_PEP_ID=MMETSP0156-20130528/17872_1 /TAXON_ID=33649 /ORGANISM="Thalassionema nitzschioides, Strain L26-B" /LENGTH=340 /DNA_ID=CAMNT_0038944441 /DNA_START=203 /DNA_END=1225 /DNA_ORIENTATION=+